MRIAEARELVRHLESTGALRIDSQDVLVRLEARKAGYAGTLRAPLTKGGGSFAADLPAQIEQLLPSTAVRSLPHRNRWSRLAASSAGGISGMTRLSIDPLDGRPRIVVQLPERDDPIAEIIALAADTAFAVQKRFGALADHVRTISFDHSVEGMAAGQIAGVAKHRPGWIHLNANFTFVEGFESFGVSAWGGIDRTVAHEFWHEMEFAWEARNYTQTIEFRREIGGWFGHATLERVFDDPVARSELAARVSQYAATNRLEATAEMFKRWWCGPAPPDSIAERFGALVGKYFPASATVQG